MKLKSDIHISMVIIKFMREAESLHYPHKTSIVQTDQGGRFLSGELLRFYALKGIRHIMSAAHARHQNGRTERVMGLYKKWPRGECTFGSYHTSCVSIVVQTSVVFPPVESNGTIWTPGRRLISLAGVTCMSTLAHFLFVTKKASVFYSGTKQTNKERSKKIGVWRRERYRKTGRS